MTTATGIGKWVKVAKARGAGYTCKLCGKLFQQGWQFYADDKPLVAVMSACDDCADAL